MKFSVIIPVFNTEKYLRKCIDSVILQTFQSWELILVDDGSIDSSSSICDAYSQQDSRVKTIHKKNGGLSDARNTGIEAAHGDYLLFLDSDDYWNTPLMLEEISQILEEYKVEIVQFGQARLYSNKSDIITGQDRYISQYNGATTKTVLNQLVQRGWLSISACSMAISRDFVKKNKLFFLSGIKSEDLEWAVRMYTYEPRWAFIDKYYYVYRYAREGSITSTIDFDHLADYCWILEQCIPRVECAGEDIKVPLMSYIMYHTLIASALSYRDSVCLTRKQRDVLINRLETIARDRMLHYTMNKKVKLASYIYRAIGFRGMIRILGTYLNYRGR